MYQIHLKEFAEDRDKQDKLIDLVLEIVNDSRRTAFDDGYELGKEEADDSIMTKLKSALEKARSEAESAIDYIEEALDYIDE